MQSMVNALLYVCRGGEQHKIGPEGGPQLQEALQYHTELSPAAIECVARCWAATEGVPCDCKTKTLMSSCECLTCDAHPCDDCDWCGPPIVAAAPYQDQSNFQFQDFYKFLDLN